MISFLKKILEDTGKYIKGSPGLKKLYPIFEATDDFFFGTKKITQGAPHIADALDIKRYMSLVIVALIPATVAGVYFYGLRVIAVIVVSYTVGGLVEVGFSVFRRKPIYEGFLVTGLIFPLILPASIPLWMVGVGVAFGAFFGKEVFGGTGKNIFNPALVGRVFLSLAFPNYFTTRWSIPFTEGLGGFIRYSTDAVTSATPLIQFKTEQLVAGVHPLLFGMTPGSIGETFRIGIIAGGLFLILVKIIDWRIPLMYIASVVAFSYAGQSIWPALYAPPVFQVLSGGLLFGAFFMATDPVTAPLTFEGKWISGALLGVLTVLMRTLSGFVEGVMFSILIINAFSPLIDSLVINIRARRYAVLTDQPDTEPYTRRKDDQKKA